MQLARDVITETAPFSVDSHSILTCLRNSCLIVVLSTSLMGEDTSKKKNYSSRKDFSRVSRVANKLRNNARGSGSP